VQVGAFRVKDNALALAKELRENGYDTYIIYEEVEK
jgi:cell division septation protein DedD